MTNTLIPVPSLVGGVSQQAAELRLPHQCEAQQNMWVSPIKGLYDRPPFVYTELLSASTAASTIHAIRRDVDERYLVLMQSASLKVFGLDGEEFPVHGPTGPAYTPDFTYVTTSDPKADLRAVTIADYSLILNRSIEVEMDVATTSADSGATTGHAFLYIRAGNYSANYTVKLKPGAGATETFVVSTYDGSSSTASNIDQWMLQILTPGNSGTTWSIVANGTTSNYTVQVGDSAYDVGEGWRPVIDAQTNMGAFGSGSFIRVVTDGAAVDPVVTPSTGGTYTLTRIMTTVNTDDIAERFKQLIDDSGNFTAEREGSVVRITSSSAITQFDIADSAGDTAMIRVNRELDNFDDLPDTCQDGYIVKVFGDPTTGDDDYYVTFDADVSGDFSRGKWIEGLAAGSTYILDATTMPHKLVRKQDDGLGTVTGTPDQIYFEFAPVDWNDRTVGDTTSNPNPSFVGQTINDIFFYRGRLGLLANQNCILSEANVYFNFFRATVRQLLDTDLIDIQASNTKVALLYNAVSIDEELLVFSDQTQYILTSEPLLSPKTAALQPVSELTNISSCRPLSLAKTVLFPVDHGGYTGFTEMYRYPDTNTFVSADITPHIPNYVLGKATRMSWSSTESIVTILTDDVKSYQFWTYRFVQDGNERTLSSWSKNTIVQGDIVGLEWYDSILYAVVKYSDGHYLLTLDASNTAADDEGYWIHLDRRITDAELVSATYSAVTGHTTLTVPFTKATGGWSVVTRFTGAPGEDWGVILPALSETSTTIVVNGDHSATPLWIGMDTVRQYEFSKPILRERTDRGLVPVLNGRLQVRHLRLRFKDTGYFIVRVSLDSRDNAEYEYTGLILNNESWTLGSPNIHDGEFLVPIRSRNDRMSVTIENDSHLPCQFTGAEWNTSYTSKGTRARI